VNILLFPDSWFGQHWFSLHKSRNFILLIIIYETLGSPIKVVFLFLIDPPLSDGTGASGGAVVEALRYKTEGRGFDSRWSHWNFSLT
jgi:hypothetical protein